MAAMAVRFTTVITTLAVCMAGLLLTADPASASSAAPSAEALAIRLINTEREARGLKPLARNLQMTRHGRDWAMAMSATGRVEHRRDLAAVVDGDFKRLGENVGFTRLEGATVGTLVRRLHKGFMNSSGHRYHVLGNYNMVGVGIFRDRSGGMWMAVNFLKGARDGFPLYRDIAGTRVERPVGRMFVSGVLTGCDGNRYCPRRTVTRAEMSRALTNGTGSREAATYMASSCTTASCAAENITRVEAAHMIATSLGLKGKLIRRYSDVASSDSAVVNAVVDAGIMGTCGTTRFCPDGTVRRGALAKILVRALR
jgi:uncharacterized protein YkwD